MILINLNYVKLWLVPLPTIFFYPQLAGTCGQLLTPTGGHANVDSINMVQVPSQNMTSHPGYIVPRSIHPNPPQVNHIDAIEFPF